MMDVLIALGNFVLQNFDQSIQSITTQSWK